MGGMTADPDSARLIPLGGLRELLAGLMKGREHLSREPYVMPRWDRLAPAAPLPRIRDCG